MSSLIDGNALPSASARFFIQISLVLALSQILGMILKRIRQPRVVAEILAGIILGPTCLSRISRFRDVVFPTESILGIETAASLGLIFYVFLVGLSINIRDLKRHAKRSMFIASSSYAACIAISAGVSKLFDDPMYHNTEYGSLLLIMGLILATSALPVLARMLNDLNLVNTTVGSIILVTSVADDVVGYTLLAVWGAISQGSTSLSILWIILLMIGQGFFAFFAFGPLIRYLAHRTVVRGRVTPSRYLGVIMAVLIQAWLTESIGISSIIGALEIGLLVPRDTPLAAQLPIVLESLVSIVLLPLFFVLSGLRTNFGLIDSWLTFGLSCLLIILAAIGKGGSVYISSRLMKFPLNSALMTSILMTTKGLVALIIGNIALESGAITDKLFSIFTLLVLVSTLGSTPLLQLCGFIFRRGLSPGEQPVFLGPPDEVEEEVRDTTRAARRADGGGVQSPGESPVRDFESAPKRMPAFSMDSTATESMDQELDAETIRLSTLAVLGGGVPDIEEAFHQQPQGDRPRSHRRAGSLRATQSLY